MLKVNSVASFQLAPRAAADTDTPGVLYPHMVGHLDRKYLLEGHYVINEETGQKYLRLVVLENDDQVLCEGKLFRDTTHYARPRYTGFLRFYEEAKADGSDPRSWQIELSAELGQVGEYSRNSHLWGRAFFPQDAAEHSFNHVLKESGIAF